ncbi:Uncharacterized protein ToN1_40680 [Aromatoleum petrolei]|nr:Uncharacterized protein ToN1_40680 [Aromatoleum petrolei]
MRANVETAKRELRIASGAAVIEGMHMGLNRPHRAHVLAVRGGLGEKTALRTVPDFAASQVLGPRHRVSVSGKSPF